MLKAIEKGHEVFLLVMTESLTPEIRRGEQETAARFLKAKKLFWGGFQDTNLTASREVINAIEKVLGEVQPDAVFVNSPDDAHQDHQALGSCTVTACRYIQRVFFYHDYTALNFKPDTFVDIGDVLRKKQDLLACHRSQVSKAYPTGLDLLESVSALAAFYGFMAKVKYAEAFRPLRNLMTLC